jgi:hypothetical protein
MTIIMDGELCTVDETTVPRKLRDFAGMYIKSQGEPILFQDLRSLGQKVTDIGTFPNYSYRRSDV